MKTKSSVLGRPVAQKPGIVAVIASLKDVRTALRNPGLADIYEWRVDCIHSKHAVQAIKRLNILGKAIILTVRDPNEGGKRPSWNRDRREKLIRKYLYLASIVDIEINCVIKFRKLIADIQRKGIRVNFSFHVLELVPFAVVRVSLDWFVQIFESFGIAGDILKFAVKVDDSSEMRLLSRYFYRLMKKFPGQIAPMPIGEKYGRSKRLEYARRGAALVYCHLGQAVIAGQWHVTDLRQKLA